MFLFNCLVAGPTLVWVLGMVVACGLSSTDPGNFDADDADVWTLSTHDLVRRT